MKKDFAKQFDDKNIEQILIKLFERSYKNTSRSLGRPGRKGRTGATGRKGDTGDQGDQGIKDNQGPKGLS